MMTTGFSAMVENSLVLLISDFVQNTPSEIVHEVLEIIHDWHTTPTDFQKIKLFSSIQSPLSKDKLKKIIDCWEKYFPELSSDGIYFSIQASLATFRTLSMPPVELIWTGPEDLTTTLRRTDQALLELIQGANEHLLIVSFAVYKARPIIEALEAAILRNVKVIVCLEDLDGCHGKLSFSGLNAFSESVFKLASFYTWPIENRPHTVDGKFGSLHSKIVVADQEKVFISSANLTDYAMDLNIEMGVLLKDRALGEQINNLFNNMILNSVFRKIAIKS
jgi:phosphatidylserine/phosphatidylglycerophosphate/cardiolipin synthase-like enzyme